MGGTTRMRIEEGAVFHGQLTVYAPAGGPPARPTPSAQADKTTLVAKPSKPLPDEDAAVSLPKGVAPNFDVKNLSPRQMAGLGMELYALGVVSFEEYGLLAFQSELHPDFDRTIGALTGEKADPNRKRDFLAHWEARADFERRHNPSTSQRVRRAGHIAAVLRQISQPMDVVA